MYSRGQLADDLRKLGITVNDTVMVHASVRAVGEVAGGPDQIHLALKDAVGPGGNLIMYASCPDYVDEVGRGDLTPDEEKEILEKLPAYDPLTARSARSNGTLVEFFRTWPGVVVSRHVARFVVSGSQANNIVSSQPWNYAFGAGSPLDKLLELNGKIVLLGSDHDAVTFLHYVEHIADFPGKRIARYKVPIEKDGQRIWVDMEEVNTADEGAHENWPDRFFAKIVDSYLLTTGNRGGPVGNAMTYVIPARALLEFAEPIMKAVADDASAVNVLIPSSRT